MNQYKRSMDILKVTKWTGVISSFITLGVDAVGYMDTTSNVLQPLKTAGIGIGIITGIIERKLSPKPTHYSYLISMKTLGKNDFNNYNYSLYRKIEEFIND